MYHPLWRIVFDITSLRYFTGENVGVVSLQKVRFYVRFGNLMVYMFRSSDTSPASSRQPFVRHLQTPLTLRQLAT